MTDGKQINYKAVEGCLSKHLYGKGNDSVLNKQKSISMKLGIRHG